jgi:hypothetical protein
MPVGDLIALGSCLKDGGEVMGAQLPGLDDRDLTDACILVQE